MGTQQEQPVSIREERRAQLISALEMLAAADDGEYLRIRDLFPAVDTKSNMWPNNAMLSLIDRFNVKMASRARLYAFKERMTETEIVTLVDATWPESGPQIGGYALTKFAPIHYQGVELDSSGNPIEPEPPPAAESETVYERNLGQVATALERIAARLAETPTQPAPTQTAPAATQPLDPVFATQQRNILEAVNKIATYVTARTTPTVAPIAQALTVNFKPILDALAAESQRRIVAERLITNRLDAIDDSIRKLAEKIDAARSTDAKRHETLRQLLGGVKNGNLDEITETVRKAMLEARVKVAPSVMDQLNAMDEGLAIILQTLRGMPVGYAANLEAATSNGKKGG